MAGRSGRGRMDHSSPLVDLELVFADDEYIDGIASSPWGAGFDRPSMAGSAAACATSLAPGSVLTADPLTDLFQTWRTELAVVPIPAPPPVRRAADALERGRARRRRSLRPMLSVAAAIAALLVGSATVGSKNATPDSPLWPITQVMWPDRAQSVASVNLVRTELSKAQDSLDAGDTREAQLAVLRATTELGKVDDVDGKEDLQNQVSDMWRKAAPAELASTSPFAAPSGSSWPSSPFTDPDPAVVTTAPSLQPPANVTLADVIAGSADSVVTSGLAPSIGTPTSGAVLAAPAGPNTTAIGPASVLPSSAPLTVVSDTPTATPTPTTASDPGPPPVQTSAPSTLPEPVVPVDPPPVLTPTDPATASTAELSPPAPTPSLPTTSDGQPATQGADPLGVGQQSVSAGTAASTTALDQPTTVSDPVTTN